MTSGKQQEKQDNENYSKNFTRVPNIVFVSYKYLTKEEKFLYCTLRQVYWDMKPRFVSLRDLSEATGYAVGALSKMLPRLHTCGLIHSEIRHEKGKDGKVKGHAKYHITIPDIWELNRKYFEASSEEQAAMDPSLKLAQGIVHQMNNTKDCSPNDTELFTKCDSSVHQMNDIVPFREQSQAQLERAKDKKDISKDERKNEQSRQTSPISTSDESFIRSSNFSSSFSSQETKPQISLTEDEQRIVKFAQKDLFKAMLPEASEKLKNECAALAPHIKTQEQFDSLLGHVRAKLKAPYHLKNMVNALNDWMQTQEQEKKPLKVKDLAMRPLRDLATQQREMERKYYEKQATLGKRKAEMDGISGEEVTDAQIAATIRKWARLYKDTEHEEEYQSRVAQIQRGCGLDNSTFFGLLYNAKDDTDYSGDKSMDSFFRMLDKQLGRKRVLA